VLYDGAPPTAGLRTTAGTPPFGRGVANAPASISRVGSTSNLTLRMSVDSTIGPSMSEVVADADARAHPEA
jgi:hypothetical protein